GQRVDEAQSHCRVSVTRVGQLHGLLRISAKESTARLTQKQTPFCAVLAGSGDSSDETHTDRHSTVDRRAAVVRCWHEALLTRALSSRLGEPVPWIPQCRRPSRTAHRIDLDTQRHLRAIDTFRCCCERKWAGPICPAVQ